MEREYQPPGTKSGLTVEVLLKHAKSKLLERHKGQPIYLHSASHPGCCDDGCNGVMGYRIAEDVAALDGACG